MKVLLYETKIKQDIVRVLEHPRNGTPIIETAKEETKIFATCSGEYVIGHFPVCANDKIFPKRSDRNRVFLAIVQKNGVVRKGMLSCFDCKEKNYCSLYGEGMVCDYFSRK